MSELVTAHQALLGWSGKTPDRVFLHQPVNGQLRETTWQQAADNTRRIANALLSLDLVPGDKVAILAKNSAEWLLVQIAEYHVPHGGTSGCNNKTDDQNSG